MQIVYRSGTVVSVPDNQYRGVKRTPYPTKKTFGFNFRSKMRIFDAAHIQHTQLCRQSNVIDHATGELMNADINHCFLTPTFHTYDAMANEAIKRFTDNLTKNYGCTSYVWVKEFTKKMVPHYHMLVTIPRVPIKELNRAWSRARGDRETVSNALRTGWDKRRQRSVMIIKNYKQAVGYAAKYILKSGGGDICVLKSSCRVHDRKTWEFREGHSTKCYGMSQNLRSDPRQLDLFLQFHLHPFLTKKVKEQKSEYCDLFFFDDPRTCDYLYSLGDEIKRNSGDLIENNPDLITNQPKTIYPAQKPIPFS